MANEKKTAQLCPYVGPPRPGIPLEWDGNGYRTTRAVAKGEIFIFQHKPRLVLLCKPSPRLPAGALVKINLVTGEQNEPR